MEEENKYLVSMRKANKKYRETHREKYNAMMKNYYHSRKDDEEFMNKQREKARKYYHKKKEQQKQQLENPEIPNI